MRNGSLIHVVITLLLIGAAFWIGRATASPPIIAPPTIAAGDPKAAESAVPPPAVVAEPPRRALAEEAPADLKALIADLEARLGHTLQLEGAVDASLQAQLQQAADSFASGNDGGHAVATPATISAIETALAPTAKAYADAVELVNATRSAIVDRLIAEGRYEVVGAGGKATGYAQGALVNAMRGLPDGRVANVVVKKGEAPELEDAMRLMFGISFERRALAMELLQDQFSPSASRDAAAPTGSQGGK